MIKDVIAQPTSSCYLPFLKCRFKKGRKNGKCDSFFPHLKKVNSQKITSGIPLADGIPDRITNGIAVSRRGLNAKQNYRLLV